MEEGGGNPFFEHQWAGQMMSVAVLLFGDPVRGEVDAPGPVGQEAWLTVLEDQEMAFPLVAGAALLSPTSPSAAVVAAAGLVILGQAAVDEQEEEGVQSEGDTLLLLLDDQTAARVGTLHVCQIPSVG